MKKNSLFFMPVLACVILFVTSCKKDDDPVALTKTEILTSNTWVITSEKINGVEVFTSATPACEQDDIIKFEKTGNKYSREEGAIKCDLSQAETGTWALKSDDTILTFNTGYPTDMKIEKFESTFFVLSFETVLSGIAIKTEVTYSKK